MCFSIKTCNLCKTRIKSKQVYRVLEFDQSQWLKLYVQYNTEKLMKTEKESRQRWKMVVKINEKCCIQ